MPDTLERLLIQALEEFGFAAGSAETRQFCRYLKLLEKWNSHVNLTASMEWRSLGAFFCEGIWAARFFPDEPGIHMDIGSGAGFPAIPVRILRPKLKLQLVESRLKRVAFLEAVARELDLAGTVVEQQRLEDFLAQDRERTDLSSVSWKALKLNRREADGLLARSTSKTHFYLFHGRTLSLEDPAGWEEQTELLARHSCPFREGWLLSIYSRKPGT